MSSVSIMTLHIILCSNLRGGYQLAVI